MSIRCALGTTVIVFLGIVVLVIVLCGIGWVMDHSIIVRWILGIAIVAVMLFYIGDIWWEIYKQCVEKRKELGR